MAGEWSYFAGTTGPGGVPVGTVLPYAGPLAATDTQPSGLNLSEVQARLAAAGWLPCDGRSLVCKAYPLLYGVIGNAFGGDGSHFCVPDMRGRFMRGVDGGAGRDPSLDKRVASGTGGNAGNQVGSVQPDAYQGHEHQYTQPGAAAAAQAGTGQPVALPSTPPQVATAGEQADTLDGDGTPRADKETRPVNLYFNYIIRFR